MWKAPARLDQITQARAFAQYAASRARLSPRSAERLVLAVDEAFTNAIEAGAENVEIAAALDIPDRTVTVTVADDGPGADLDRLMPAAMPDVRAERGRGIPIIRSIDPGAEWARSPNGGLEVTLSVSTPHEEPA